MYDYTTYHDFISAIRSTSDIRTFRSAVRGYLNDAAMHWWRGLQENERKAIILLDFDPSVVTTMAFFGRGWGLDGDYHDVLNAILYKADLLTGEEELGNWDYDCDLRTIIHYAQEQANAEKIAREKAAAIAQEMDLGADFDVLENLLVKKSGTVRNNEKRKTESAKKMRKAFLADALNYLRKNYNNEEEGE